MPAEPSSPPPPDRDREERRVAGMRQFALAMELPFIVVAAVAVGGLIGHTLDERLRTAPFLMIFFGALGLYAGIREVLRRLTKTGARGGGNAGR